MRALLSKFSTFNRDIREVVSSVLGVRGAISLLGVAVLALASSLCLVWLPKLLSSLVTSDPTDRPLMAILFLGTTFLQIVTSALAGVFEQAVVQRRTAVLRTTLLERLYVAPLWRASELLDIYPVVSVTEVPRAVSGIVKPFLSFLRNTSLIVGVFFFVTQIDVRLIVLGLLILVAGALVVAKGLKPIEVRGVEAIAANQRFSEAQFGLAKYYCEVRNFLTNREQLRRSRLSQSVWGLYSKAWKLLLVKTKYGLSAELFFGFAAPILAVVACLTLVSDGELSPSGIMELFLYLSMLVDPVRSTAGASFDWQYTRTLARRIQSFIDVSNDGRIESERSSCIIPFRGERNGPFDLEFRSVEKALSQEGGERLVAYSGKLRGPGLNVVVGPSGAGKSTLVRILAGVDYYSSGAVVDGQGQELCPAMLREIFGYAQQEPGYCEGLVENLNNATESGDSLPVDMVDALEVQKLLPRLESQSFYGAAFSGGEMKRLSIIYALTLGRRGIILDEPTNGLNDEIVERFLTTLREYRSTRTWVIVTHDKRVRAIADNVLVVG